MKIILEFDSMEDVEAFRNQSARCGRRGKELRGHPVAKSSLTVRTQYLLLGEKIDLIEAAQELGTALLRVPNLGRKSMREIMDWKPVEGVDFPIPHEVIPVRGA